MLFFSLQALGSVDDAVQSLAAVAKCSTAPWCALLESHTSTKKEGPSGGVTVEEIDDSYDSELGGMVMVWR